MARSRALDGAVLQLALATAILAGVQIALVTTTPLSLSWPLVLPAAGSLVYLVAGVVAWLRRPGSRFGALLTAGGLTWLTAGFINTDVPALIALGQITATVPLAIVVHQLLAFPTGRLVGTGARLLVAAAYATALVLQAPLYLFADVPPPYDVLQVAARPDLEQAGIWFQRVVGLGVVSVTAVVLVRRLHSADVARRWVLGPLYTYGIATVLLVPLLGSVIRPWADLSVITVFVCQVVLLGLVPVAFGFTLLRGGFARTAQIEELGTWLGADEHRRPGLGAAIASTLGDPSLEVAFWVPDLGGYVDGDGLPVAWPPTGSGRASVGVDLAGRRVGAISYDSTILDDPELVRTVGRVVAIAVDRERLTADLRANQEALRQSRRRIVEAGDRERRRIERNLHDGAQQRMMGLALALRMAEARANGSDPGMGMLLADAAAELERATQDLRVLARGLHPALLADAGLGGALESLAERSSIPVRLSVRVPSELPETIGVGAYYVVAEALTNAARHSGAAHVSVSAQHSDGSLRVEVGDDGSGGAVVRPGSGLEGLADRVDSLGGRFQVTSPASGGTRLVAELPCG